MFILARGDTNGIHRINTDFIESVVTMPMNPRGDYSMMIRMVSGKEYYRVFADYETQIAFVQSLTETTQGRKKEEDGVQQSDVARPYPDPPE